MKRLILKDETTGTSKDFGVNREDYAKAATEIKRLMNEGHVLSGEAVEKVKKYYGASFE